MTRRTTDAFDELVAEVETYVELKHKGLVSYRTRRVVEGAAQNFVDLLNDEQDEIRVATYEAEEAPF